MSQLNSSYKRWSLDCHDVSVEILEDLGVSAIEDDSCSNNSSVKKLTVTNKPEKLDKFDKKSDQLEQGVKRKAEHSPIHFADSPDDEEEEEDSNDSFSLCKRRRIEAPLGQYGFSKLSDEIMLCVFKWLPKSTVAKCAQVSKRWKRLSYDEVLWKRLDLSGSCLKPTILGTVLLRGTQVLRLAKSEVPPSNPRFKIHLIHQPIIWTRFAIQSIPKKHLLIIYVPVFVTSSISIWACQQYRQKVSITIENGYNILSF